MLTKYTPKNREQLKIITLDHLVPGTIRFGKWKPLLISPSFTHYSKRLIRLHEVAPV